MGVPGRIEKKQGVKMIELFINKWSMIRLEQKLKFAGFTISKIIFALVKERLNILLSEKSWSLWRPLIFNLSYFYHIRNFGKNIFLTT